MSPFGASFSLIYFIYGLAFFSLGISLLLESRRTPSITLGRRLLPLSIFGLLHGSHEWLEFFILQNQASGMSPFLEMVRLMLLVISFASLLAYGVKTLQAAFEHRLYDPLVGTVTLLIYAALIAALAPHPFGTRAWFQDADALARITIAIPASLLTVFALRKRTIELGKEQRDTIARPLSTASIGFLIYTLSQVFVPRAAVLYAPYLNSTVFEQVAGIPIQLPRTVVAGVIALALIRATQAAENERQEELEHAQQARLAALEQASLELQKRETLQKETLRSIVIAQEDERRRISRELHDETAQTLTALDLTVAAIRNQVPNDAQVQENIGRIQELNRQMSRGLKRLVHQLRPAQLDDLGLYAALEYLVDDAKNNLQLDVTLSAPLQQKRLEPLIETVLFRVAQECLTNIARHAKTTQARITLEEDPGAIILAIQDEGAGFDPSLRSESPGSTGLVGIQERVEAVGGSVEIISTVGVGTRIRATVPHPQSIEDSR